MEEDPQRLLPSPQSEKEPPSGIRLNKEHDKICTQPRVIAPTLPSAPPRSSLGPKFAPPIPAKISGKPPPPIPLSKQIAAPSDSLSSTGQADKGKGVSDLINLHWKPASSTQTMRRFSIVANDSDQFLKPFSVELSSSLDKLLRDNPVPHVLLDSSDEVTVFANPDIESQVPKLQRDLLRKYFSKKQNNKFDIATINQSAVVREETAGKKSGLDRERVKLIALALGGTITSRVNRRSIFRQYKEAIIRCDNQIVTTDIMCPLLQLLKSVQEEELQSSVTYVRAELNQSQNPELVVLEEFEEPDVFLYEMSKIPELKIRLECMIFERTFDDLFQITVNSMNVIYAGLEVIASNVQKITKLFKLILNTGNYLNEGSKLGGSQGSFCLSTLSKLTEVKSSVDPKLDVLHFILSHIPHEEAVLFTDEELSKLKNASNLRSYRVRDEVKDLLDSVVAVTEIVKHPVPSAGDEDRFTLRMSQFAQRIRGTDQWLSKYAFNVFASYKRLSAYFEDVKSVYPPPKEKSPDQFDIVELFAWFGSILKTHEKEVKKKGLREKVLTSGPISLSPPADVGVAQYPVSPPEDSPSPLTTIKTGSPDPSYVLEVAQSGSKSTGSSRTLLQNEKPSRPSLTKEQLQSSLSSLGSPAAPPLVAIINRGTGKDLTASRPKLSPLVSPVIDFTVTPAISPPETPKASESSLRPPPFVAQDGSRRTLSVKELGSSITSKSLVPPLARKPHMLITPQGSLKQSSRPEITFSVSSGVIPVPTDQSDHSRRSDENAAFIAPRAYPSRNEEFFPNYAVLNSRQSLSNTISRVAMLLSPGKDEGGSALYKGTRRRVPSLSATSPQKSD
jgi:hypothetical protein